MDISDYIALALVTVVWFLFCMVVTVIVHETGHLIGGLISGYRLSGFAVSGVMLRRQEGKLKWKRYSPSCLNWGQCFMFSREINAPPEFLISGGGIMNIFVGAVLTVITILSISLDEKGIWRLMLLAVPASINLVMGIANLTSGSASSDGNTLKEVKGKDGIRMYNRVMMITAELLDGKMYSEMAPELFEYSGSSSLAEELKMYGYYRKFEECHSESVYSELAVKSGFHGKGLGGKFFLDEKRTETELAAAVLSDKDEPYFGKMPAEGRELLLILARHGYNQDADKRLAEFTKKCPMPGLARSASRCWENIKEIRKERFGNYG